MYLLRSLVNEGDMLVTPGCVENAVVADLHNILKENYSVYREAVSIDVFAELDDKDAYLPIVRNSISSLLLPTSSDFLR